jgi:3'-5' exoribonuclease 1
LQKRLKSHTKKEKLLKAKLEQEKNKKIIQYYCIIDFEATCEKDNPEGYKHEIIEFPGVLVDAATLQVVSLTLCQK